MAKKKLATDIESALEQLPPVPTDMFHSHVYAWVLNELAQTLPDRFISKPVLAKVVFGLKRVPPKDSPFVRRLSGLTPTMRKVLRETYARGWDTDKTAAHSGVRATVDGADANRTQVCKDEKAAQKKVEEFRASVAAINPEDIKSAEDKKLYAEHLRNAKQLKPFGTTALLAPKTVDEYLNPTEE